jgi:hypothetical protein
MESARIQSHKGSSVSDEVNQASLTLRVCLTLLFCSEARAKR